ncbi:DNA-binding transcriptional regulator, AcrR family [Amycolatopsis sacchari]|uniref:DNA-binding transcriptional regulator, AcrR family n=1 Tax=Amycolatopsis sacchari TaxID=115433 RepID=A0A1I3RG53_9PSEU|nr:TetR/AcrR family transcriptional regulator [Amycolatopsis sacchari]SFJ44842.1 DNA-binding transcriptional regulator, AcrR family [Amycolatopsis sacchari]
MGHRENLLDAARKCLLQAGYARTTARDLAAASGANLASINYHFGSKDGLLTQALHDLNVEWGELLFQVLDDGPEPGPDVRAAHEARWARIIESIQAHRELWFVNFEEVAQLQRDEKIRAMVAEGQRAARAALASAFGGVDAEAEPELARAVGSHYYSLLVGLALQWLTDPDSAPTAAEVVTADHHLTPKA